MRLNCVSYNHIASPQSCAVPWARVRSACTSHSPSRWHSPGGAAGSTCLQWRPRSHCRSMWVLPGCPWSYSCSLDIPASWASALSGRGKDTRRYVRKKVKNTYIIIGIKAFCFVARNQAFFFRQPLNNCNISNLETNKIHQHLLYDVPNGIHGK